MGCWNNYMGSYLFVPQQSFAINLPHALARLDENGAGPYADDYAVVIAGFPWCASCPS